MKPKHRYTFLALCGYPEVGKTFIQNILKEKYNILPMDDSKTLRDAVKILYSLSENDVTTQEGKNKETPIPYDRFENEDVLRLTGQVLFGLTEIEAETKIGQKTILGKTYEIKDLYDNMQSMVIEFHKTSPEVMKNRKILGQFGLLFENYYGHLFFPEIAIQKAYKMYENEEMPTISFGSVRADQGKIYQQHNGLVVEIKRPGYDVAHNDFDQYNKSIIDITINNPGDKEPLENLIKEISNKLDEYFL